MTPEYLAGFFDGEGCINITVRGKHPQVVLRCMLINTDFEFLSEVQHVFGGSLHRRPHKKRPHWKAFCEIVWTGAGAVELLLKLQPFIRLKAPQLRLALEFANFMGRPKSERCNFSHSPTPNMPCRVITTRKPETLAKELWFKQRMHDLNRKGLPIQ